MNVADYQTLVQQTSHLKPNMFKGIRVLLFVSLITVLAIYLSFSINIYAWLIGQLLYGLCVLQWFVLLHDFGHNYFFRSKFLNWFFGYVSSFFCLVPFAPWKWIHAQHHTWTGWHNLDPTQEGTLPSNATPTKRKLSNWSWKLGIPALTLAFSLQNFWNLPRLFRYFKEPAKRIQCVFSILFLITTFILQVCLIPGFLVAWTLGYCLFLIVSDPLLISQHAHVPQKIDSENKATPFSVKEQDQFTRTLLFPKWISRFILLSFDRHSLHHVLPRLACYHLINIEYRFQNSSHWFTWLTKAKKTPAETILFSNNNNTGLNL